MKGSMSEQSGPRNVDIPAAKLGRVRSRYLSVEELEERYRLIAPDELLLFIREAVVKTLRSGKTVGRLVHGRLDDEVYDQLEARVREDERLDLLHPLGHHNAGDVNWSAMLRELARSYLDTDKKYLLPFGVTRSHRTWF